ncbi:uncharacterized protein BBOV_IV002540 [Babesia bovis T2Bo]|uniref:GRAM domain-containing protein n=1 Tax=Babesia bovis TaxID=5865 RepID=A7AVM5_BABBO|nr:uncharacterized protein BBOV_IV002540 [Babesia bovis T2Bo]EDO05851.1 hypothetical protein BBOV_IV002540 [Babesia bovis T2Bo]|eukprot:XP_001609419.1 hypothetical protein [Babesia bovis T2Bo]
MALNPVLTQDVHTKQLLPLCDSGEFLLMHRPYTKFELKISDRVMKGSGDTFVTTHRIVFVKNKDKKFNEQFSSLSLPYALIDEPRFRQPVFGSNYLEGVIKPDSSATIPIKETGMFYIYFDRGCGMFLKGFYMSYARIRNNPAYTVNAHPFASGSELGSAFVDPNDPTHVYIAQPETSDPVDVSKGDEPGESAETDAEGTNKDDKKHPGWVGGASQAAKTSTSSCPLCF